MAYSKENIQRVLEGLSQKRMRHERELQAKKEELALACPRLKEIEHELAENGMKTVSAIVIHKENATQKIEQLKSENLKLQEERARLLKSMGLPADFLTLKYDCPKCRDEGFCNGKMCSCVEKELQRLSFEELNRSSGFRLCDFDEFKLEYYPTVGDSVSPREKMEKISRYCRRYAETFSEHSKNLLMIGNTGLGKTLLSLCIAKAVIDRGYRVIYSGTQNLLRKMEKEKFSSDFDDGVSDDILSVDLLIMDDLGTEFSTPFTVSAVYNILNTRLNDGKPTIINTNLSFSELEKTYSERIVSRLIGEYVILKFCGNDIRQIKKREAMSND